MWKNYAADYIRHNRAGSGSVIAASFIAALFLSFLCSTFYHFWLDAVEGAKLENGGWHGRITAELGEDELEEIRSLPNVEKVALTGENGAVREGQASGKRETVDITFHNKRTVYRDMQDIVRTLGLSEETAEYNYQLLSLYFVRIPGDTMPRLLMPAYLAIVVMVCISLILVIHNSFAVSMNNRIRQFGIFSGIGATKRQILACLMEEAFVLSAVPILFGILLGVVLSFVTVRAMGTFAANLAGGRKMDFALHPVVLILIFLLALLTVLISAWIPAQRLSRLTPLEAIRGAGGAELMKKKHSPLLSALFGMEGELAGNALKAQKKALRTTSFSLTLAFLGFMLMQCFFTLSGISTRHTYFEAYQDVWDIYIRVKDEKIENFEQIDEVRAVEGAESCIVYQKAEAVSMIPAKDISQELAAAGGLEELAGIYLEEEGNAYPIGTPLVILDDQSFAEYCREIGIEEEAGQEGVIVLNRIWNSAESNFRYPEYLPYIQADTQKITLLGKGYSDDKTAISGEMPEDTAGSVMAEVPVLACTGKAPALREDYGKPDYPLVQFISLGYWSKALERIGGTEKDIFIRVLAKDRESSEAADRLEDSLTGMVDKKYEIESENRIREKKDNDTMIQGYELILGGVCAFFALMGIAHVFSNTAGFIRQRKREFARYMSVGLTPEGMRKIFCIEAVAVVGRPLAVSLFLTIAVTAGMIRASYLDPAEFMREAPILPILAFVLAVFGFVALAYLTGGRKILRMDLAEALRDDTML